MYAIEDGVKRGISYVGQSHLTSRLVWVNNPLVRLTAYFLFKSNKRKTVLLRQTDPDVINNNVNKNSFDEKRFLLQQNSNKL